MFVSSCRITCILAVLLVGMVITSISW